MTELKAELEEATDAYHSAPWASHFRTEEDGGSPLTPGREVVLSASKSQVPFFQIL